MPAAKSKSGFSQAIILPGLSRPFGIVLALERELDRVGLLHAALLEGVAVGIEDHRAHRFVLGDDLVKSRFGGEAHERQTGEGDPAVEADHLEMAHDLVAEMVVDSLDGLEAAIGRVAGLEIGDFGIDAQRAQRRMVPGQFVIGGQAGERFGLRFGRVEQNSRLAERPGEGAEGVERVGRDHQDDDARAFGNQRAMAQEIGVRRRRGDDGDELLQDPVLLAERERISGCGVETVEPDNDVGPVVVRGERRLDLDDDAVGAIGVHRLVQVRSRELERARLGFEGKHLEPQNVAQIAQSPPGDRTDPAGAARDEASDRGRAAGRWKHAQFLPGWCGRLVDVDEDRARLADDAAALDRLDLVHLGQVQEHPAGQGHRLAIVAGAGAARGDRDLEPVGGGEDGAHFRFARRRHDDVGGHRLELALQHRRIPVEVAALLSDQNGIVLPLDRADEIAKGGDVVAAIHGARPLRPSSSA